MIDDIAEAIRAAKSALQSCAEIECRYADGENEQDKAIALLDTALSVIQKDMVIVPREATEEMMDAASDIITEHDDDYKETGLCEAERIWNAMLSVVE